MSQGVCRFYNTTGKCRFGKHCRFSHIVENIETNPSFSNISNDGILSDSSPNKSSVAVVDHFSTKAEPTQNDGSLNYPTHRSTEGAVPPETNICRSYAKNRFCRYGKRCRYLHIQLSKVNNKASKEHARVRSGNVTTTAGRDIDHEKEEEEETQQVGDEQEVQDEGSELNQVLKTIVLEEEQKSQERKVCHFFQRGFCHYGKKCRYLHSKEHKAANNSLRKDGTGDQKQDSKEQSESFRVVRPTSQVPHIQVYNRESISTENLKELRETELRQLKRRFPKDKLDIVEECDSLSKYIFTFCPTDPDWPYDVKVFIIEVEFPGSYPSELFRLSLPVEQDLPETVRRYIEVSLQEWTEKKSQELKDKGIVELIFRPFVRWLDRNMQEIVTEGLRQLRRELTARAAGFEFISAKQLQKEAETKSSPDPEQNFEHSSDSDESDDYQEYPEEKFAVVYRKDEHTPEEVYTGPEKHEHDDKDYRSDDESDEGGDNDNDDENENRDISKLVSPDTERKGTEMVFRNMQLYYFSASILVEKIQLTVQCERCKHKTEFATPPNRLNSAACGKCNNTQLVAYRAVLAHPYSSTFGYLDLEGCVAFDINLLKSILSITCMHCNKNCTVKTFIPGRPFETICRGCHNKIKFTAESVKLTQVGSSGVDTSAYSGSIHKVSIKKYRIPKDPAIQEGKPLPDNGACKHYKKSYRWFRFPCCGKCYPCDVCHDDAEGDHEMKYANRMICGFCCKEQPFAGEKPCIACSSSLTKVRSVHWEGGRGCRNKIAMSKSDSQKYSNLNKTVSRKAQEKTAGKKNTKLRHT